MLENLVMNAVRFKQKNSRFANKYLFKQKIASNLLFNRTFLIWIDEIF